MKIAFFGLEGSFDFHQIGGVDSYIRRLSLALARRGHGVEHVHYGCREAESETVVDGVLIRRFCGMRDALEYLGDTSRHVVTTYLRPLDRLAFARFCHRNRSRARFQIVYFMRPDSSLRRTAMFGDAMLRQFNGGVWCVSPRLVQAARRRGIRARLLLPPVPETYFLRNKARSENGRTRVTYLGRADRGKGIEDAVAILKHLGGVSGIEARICAYRWPHDPESCQLHEWLLHQDGISYNAAAWDRWSFEAEDEVAKILRATDILLLPYRRLSSTVDTPLLLLEGMASLCAVVARPLGDIPQVYGKSRFLIADDDFARAAAGAIKQAEGVLPQERERLLQQNARLRFDTESIARRFLLSFE